MYYIMDYNTVRGFAFGAFDNLTSLFYAKEQAYPDNPEASINFTNLLSEAKGFDTHEEALAFANDLWGERHVVHTMGIVFMSDEAMDPSMEDHAREGLKNRAETTQRLARKSYTKDELIALTKDIWKTNALTYREKWIIEILTKEDG